MTTHSLIASPYTPPSEVKHSKTETRNSFFETTSRIALKTAAFASIAIPILSVANEALFSGSNSETQPSILLGQNTTTIIPSTFETRNACIEQIVLAVFGNLINPSTWLAIPAVLSCAPYYVFGQGTGSAVTCTPEVPFTFGIGSTYVGDGTIVQSLDNFTNASFCIVEPACQNAFSLTHKHVAGLSVSSAPVSGSAGCQGKAYVASPLSGLSMKASALEELFKSIIFSYPADCCHSQTALPATCLVKFSAFPFSGTSGSLCDTAVTINPNPIQLNCNPPNFVVGQSPLVLDRSFNMSITGSPWIGRAAVVAADPTCWKNTILDYVLPEGYNLTQVMPSSSTEGWGEIAIIPSGSGSDPAHTLAAYETFLRSIAVKAVPTLTDKTCTIRFMVLAGINGVDSRNYCDYSISTAPSSQPSQHLLHPQLVPTKLCLKAGI